MLGRVTDERREGKRNRMLKGGFIAFSARHATMPCVLRDLSDTGARLQVAQSAAVPDTFELIVELDGIEVPCEVVWRKVKEIGVRFIGEPTRVAPKRTQVVGQSGPQARSTVRRGPAGLPVPAARPTPPSRPATPVAAPAAPAPVAAAAPAPEQAVRPAKLEIAPSRKGPAAPRASIPLLIAEDDPDDRMLLRDAFAESNFDHPIAFVENGEELLRYVRGEVPYEDRPFPGLILLDLNMPRMDGRTALMHLKTDSTFKRIPVIVLTTSNAEDDIQRTYDLGVTAYVAKPNSQDGLLQLVQSLNDFWMRFVHLPAA